VADVALLLTIFGGLLALSWSSWAHHRLRVWVADDVPDHLTTFWERHNRHFDIERFESPQQLLDALERPVRPDAILCEIYFVDDPAERASIDEEVRKRADDLRQLSQQYKLDESRGVQFIEDIRDRFRGLPCPIYAYTSKGPYLLQGSGFERLERLEVSWLFKDKYSPDLERGRIQNDVALFKRGRVFHSLYLLVVASGLLGAALSVILERILRHLGW